MGSFSEMSYTFENVETSFRFFLGLQVFLKSLFVGTTDFLNCPKLKIKKRSRLSDMRFDLNELLGNFQQSFQQIFLISA